MCEKPFVFASKRVFHLLAQQVIFPTKRKRLTDTEPLSAEAKLLIKFARFRSASINVFHVEFFSFLSQPVSDASSGRNDINAIAVVIIDRTIWNF